jgi:hypothetical protein
LLPLFILNRNSGFGYTSVSGWELAQRSIETSFMQKFEKRSAEPNQKPGSRRNNENQTNQSSITGRDGYIIAQALAYASEWLKTLPVMLDEPSNRSDMDAILATMFSDSWTDDLRWHAQHKLSNGTLKNPNVMIAQPGGTLAMRDA